MLHGFRHYFTNHPNCQFIDKLSNLSYKNSSAQQLNNYRQYIQIIQPLELYTLF